MFNNANKQYFSAYRAYESPKYTMVGGKSSLRIEGWGIVCLMDITTGEKYNFEMEYCPDLGFTLLSQGTMDRKGVKSITENGKVTLYFGGKRMLSGDLQDDLGLYAMDVEVTLLSRDEA